MPRRIDETPVRRRTGIIENEPSPGTPGQQTGSGNQPVRIIAPIDVAIQKYANRLRRLLGIASASPVDGYVSDIVTALLINSFNPEDLYPDDILWSGIGQAIAAGGQIAQAGFFNPANSGVLAIVEQIIVSDSVADTLQVRWLTAALGSSAQAESADDARVSTNVVQKFITTNVAAAVASVGNAFEFYLAQAGVILPVQLGPYIVPPGVGVQVNTSTQGVATLLATFKARLIKLPS